MRNGPRWNFNFNLATEEQQPKQHSSIDRFFWSKGIKIFGYAGHTWQLAGIILSVSHSIAAVVFIILSLSIQNFPRVLPLIFSIAAVLCLAGLAWNFLRGKKNNAASEIRLSATGRKLLYKIGQHIGWHDHDATYNSRGNQWASWWQNLVGIKTASDVLTPKGAELLEAGSSEYNRISGLLKLVKDSKDRSSTLSPQVQAACNEAMVSLINQVALLEDSPESQNAILSQCQIQIEKMRELADRFEEKLSGPVTLADRLSSTTVMDNVLDQLRHEAQAHEELRNMDRIDQQF